MSKTEKFEICQDCLRSNRKNKKKATFKGTISAFSISAPLLLCTEHFRTQKKKLGMFSIAMGSPIYSRYGFVKIEESNRKERLFENKKILSALAYCKCDSKPPHYVISIGKAKGHGGSLYRCKKCFIGGL